MPPQDTKWHKVPLSGRDTKWHKVYHLGSFVMFVTMATTINCIKAIFDANKENNGLHVVSMATQSWNQLKPLNLVTMATNKIYKGHSLH